MCAVCVRVMPTARCCELSHDLQQPDCGECMRSINERVLLSGEGSIALRRTKVIGTDVTCSLWQIAREE